MDRPYRIIIIEDLPSDSTLIKREITKVIGLCDFLVMDNKEEFLNGLKKFEPDIILSDFSIPGFDWQTAYQLAQKHSPYIPFIIVSGSVNPQIADDCLKAGARNFINKDNLKELGPAILEYFAMNRVGMA